MRLVERHIIKRADPRFAALDAAAFASKNLYNAALYVTRQAFIFQGISLHYPELHQHMKDHEAYQALPAKVAQQVLLVLDRNWQSYFAALARTMEWDRRMIAAMKSRRTHEGGAERDGDRFRARAYTALRTGPGGSGAHATAPGATWDGAHPTRAPHTRAAP
jgi:hypothetical protein